VITRASIQTKETLWWSRIEVVRAANRGAGPDPDAHSAGVDESAPVRLGNASAHQDHDRTQNHLGEHRRCSGGATQPFRADVVIS
jgi:hypothetical protein